MNYCCCYKISKKNSETVDECVEEKTAKSAHVCSFGFSVRGEMIYIPRGCGEKLSRFMFPAPYVVFCRKLYMQKLVGILVLILHF